VDGDGDRFWGFEGLAYNIAASAATEQDHLPRVDAKSFGVLPALEGS